MCEATLITFVALTFGEEAAGRDVRVTASVALGAAVLLGELKAKDRSWFTAAANGGRRLAGVATGGSKAA